jgi:hypothetical protein
MSSPQDNLFVGAAAHGSGDRRGHRYKRGRLRAALRNDVRVAERRVAGPLQAGGHVDEFLLEVESLL